MKTILVALLTICVLPAAAAGEKAAAQPATEFIRVDRNAKSVRLQTSITSYLKDGVSVDLVSAIHIADAGYYTQLNKEFKKYDALLYEMIGGGDMNKAKQGDAPRHAKDPVISMLGDIHKMTGKLLKLQGQKEGVDYTAKNFVHADLSHEEFAKLQGQAGESIIGFAMQNARNAQKKGVQQPDLQQLLGAVLSGNANAIKLQLVDILGQADEEFAGIKGHNIIINGRNNVCLKVLDTQIKGGKKKFGIFYGAAHFPEMEKTMLKRGYVKTAQRWLTAWHIPKEAKQAPQHRPKDPDAIPAT